MPAEATVPGNYLVFYYGNSPGPFGTCLQIPWQKLQWYQLLLLLFCTLKSSSWKHKCLQGPGWKHIWVKQAVTKSIRDAENWRTWAQSESPANPHLHPWISTASPHPPFLIPRGRNDRENNRALLGTLNHPSRATPRPLLCKFWDRPNQDYTHSQVSLFLSSFYSYFFHLSFKSV